MTLLRRHGLWLVLATLAGIAGALLVYTGRSIAYSSTAQIDVESHVVANTTPVPPNMTTETQVATSGVVVTGTASALHISPVNLRAHLSAKVSGTANILSLTCTMPTPAAAQHCATAAAASYIDFRNMASGTKTAQSHDPLQATLVTTASLPSAPAGVGKRILLPVGAVLGLLLGLAAILLRDRFDDRVRDRADVERCLDAPVIAEVPRVSRREGPPATVFGQAPHSPAAEAYRYLRTRLDPRPRAASRKGGVVLLVAGARGLEGRTSVAANLATAFAYVGDRVILVDADTQRPSLRRVFGTGYGPGLGDLLAGRASIDEAAVATCVPGLRLVATSEETGQTSDMLEASRLRQEFARMRAVADVIIVDSAPVLEVSDALGLARVSEIVVIVADPRRTSRGDASSAAQQIRAVGPGTIVGVVNRTPSSPWRRSPWHRTWPKTTPGQTPATTGPSVPAVVLPPPGGPNGQGDAKRIAAQLGRRGRPAADRDGGNNRSSGHDPEAVE